MNETLEHVSGMTWRTRKPYGVAYARVTYQPIDPWDLTKKLARPYHVFINGSAQMSYTSWEAASRHLVARGFIQMGELSHLCLPIEVDVKATSF